MSDTTDDNKPRRDSILILPEERLTLEELRSRMEEREAKKQPDSVEYQHSLLCALTLPRSRQPSREFRRDYQGRSLIIEAEIKNGDLLEICDGKQT